MSEILCLGDFPGGPVVKNPPSNAGDMGSIPGGELRSHMPCAVTTEPPSFN